MIYSLGTDISKDEFSGCLQRYDLRSQSHQVITRKTFKNKTSGFKACMSWVARHTKEQPGPVRVTMEATGVYHESLALFIQERHPQMHLAVVLPSQSKQFIKSQGYRSKTDRMDARGLALMGAERRLEAWGGIDPFWRRVRAMTRTRAELISQRTALRNQLHALEHSAGVAPEAEKALGECVQALTRQVEELTQAIKEHLRARGDLAASIACLRSIPGVGLLTTAVVLAETAGFERFDSISQLISFSGYDVVIRQSGQWVGQPHISKQGSSYIRQAMYMPATAITRRSEGPVCEFYRRLLARGGVKMKAHVAVQKKLLTYMYVLWKKQEYFDPANIRNQRQRHQKKIAPPESEATVDTSPALAG